MTRSAVLAPQIVGEQQAETLRTLLIPPQWASFLAASLRNKVPSPPAALAVGLLVAAVC